MSIWDDLKSKADTFSLDDLSSGAGTVFNAYTASEDRRVSSHQAARADQAAARYAPEVESQSGGEPMSVAFKQPERDLVGDTPKDSAVVDKKWLYIGGGVAALLLITGILVAVKK
jgi:hypothetical protein